MENIDKEFGDFMIKVGLNVKYFRNLRGITQEKLAEKVGVNRATIAHIEAPDMYYTTSTKTIFLIAKALNYPVHYFYKMHDVEQ